MHKRETVHSPIFFGKIIEIERFALRAAILHECQNYLGGEKNRGTVRDRSLFITWGGSEDFGGDHLIFRRTEGGISRN